MILVFVAEISERYKAIFGTQSPMQILGLSSSTPKTEGRLKTLLWPSVKSSSDVEVITQQGFWVCSIVAVLSFAISTFQGMFISGIIDLVFFFLAGTGVRCRSRFAAVTVFLTYFISTLAVVGVLAHPAGIVRVVFLALLLANVRATWISSRWPPSSPPAEIADAGVLEVFADRLPRFLWPKLKWVFYICAPVLMALYLMGLLYMLLRGPA